MILEEKVRDKEVKVLEASAYNDGYYWDMNAIVEYDGEIYSIVDGGSGSGYIMCYCGVKKGNLDRLYGEEQADIENLNAYERKYVIRTIVRLLDSFLESGAKNSWESSYEDDFILIDGVEVKDV